jgi:hypothetical protein
VNPPRYTDLSQFGYGNTVRIREHIASSYEASARYLSEQSLGADS